MTMSHRIQAVWLPPQPDVEEPTGPDKPEIQPPSEPPLEPHRPEHEPPRPPQAPPDRPDDEPVPVKDRLRNR